MTRRFTYRELADYQYRLKIDKTSLSREAQQDLIEELWATYDLLAEEQSAAEHWWLKATEGGAS